MIEANPFVYSHPVAARDVVGRDRETSELLGLVRGGHYAIVSAPRRYGKTSLLLKVAELARAEKLHAVSVDFDTVTSAEEAVRRIGAAYHAQLEGRARRAVEEAVRLFSPSVRFGAPGLSVGVRASAAQSRDALAELLELPRRLHERTGRRTLVIFDEFQDLLAVGEGIDGLVRSHIQHHGEQATYLFAGSQVSLMRELFADRERPLYGQAHIMRLKPLPDEPLAEHIFALFERTGRDPGEALAGVVGLASGHPQRAMLLAHHLWEVTPQGTVAGAAEFTQARTRTFAQLEESYRALWGRLTPSERVVLVSLAGGERLYSRVNLERYGLSRSAAQNARDRLISAGQELSVLRGSEPEFVDPLLREWLAQRE
jgi:hypothetical protein